MRNQAFVVLVTAACGGGGSGGGLSSRAITAEEATPLCMADCQHDIDCGSMQDLALCTTECVEGFAGWARGDAVDTFIDCASALDCAASDDSCGALVLPLPIHEDFEAMCRANLVAC